MLAYSFGCRGFLSNLRLAEFARAALENLLDGAARSKVAMQYVGLVKEDKLTELRSTLESRIYDHWETCLYAV